jgi:hypothetical protein
MNIKRYLNIFKKLDIFSKLLLILILLIIIVLVFNFFGEKRFSTKQETGFIEVDTLNEIEVIDYVFESGTKVRWPQDSYVIINLSKVLTEEDRKKIKISIVPDENVSVEFKENNLIVRFDNPSPKDSRDRVLKILYSNKLISSFNYFTSKEEPARADFDYNDLKNPRRNQ